MRGIAFGLLHMTRKEFYEMRMGEFREALIMYNNEKSADRQHIGELVRGATIRLWNLQVKKQSRITDCRKFWRMPWDSDGNRDDEIRELIHSSFEEKERAVSEFFSKIKGGRNGK